MTDVGHYEGAKRVGAARQKHPLPRRRRREPWAGGRGPECQRQLGCKVTRDTVIWGQFSPLLWASVSTSTSNSARVCILNSVGRRTLQLRAAPWGHACPGPEEALGTLPVASSPNDP